MSRSGLFDGGLGRPFEGASVPVPARCRGLRESDPGLEETSSARGRYLPAEEKYTPGILPGSLPPIGRSNSARDRRPSVTKYWLCYQALLVALAQIGRVSDWRGEHTLRGVAVVRRSRCLNPRRGSRFQPLLIEPDMQIARIRLSDKTSRLRPRHVVPKPRQAYESEVPVEVREWIGPAPASPHLVLVAQPPA